jgi:acyl-CoA dehydrogenase
MTQVLDHNALHAYLQEKGLCGTQPLTMSTLSGGQSNPTYCIQSGTTQFVLRKQPPGQLLVGAHAVDREYRVMKALQDSDVPVPRMLDYCDDSSLLGTPFYVMEFLQGRVIMDQSLPGMSTSERGEIYAEMCRVLAALHRVDYTRVGLETFGKPNNYFQRQIDRWSKQCRASTLPLGESLVRLMEWLPQHIPAAEETSIVHGDYRLDNLVFHPTQPRVIGVLDWELSTLGHPLADLSYQCMSWHVPPNLWRGIAGLDLATLGLPTEHDYVRQYAQLTGRDHIAHWDFYMAYNLFRMAAILHGIAQRAHDGNANSPDAVETGRKAQPLADIGWQCAMRYQSSI